MPKEDQTCSYLHVYLSVSGCLLAYLPVSALYVPISLLDMNWFVSRVFPTSEAPSIRTVKRGEQRLLFREEQASSSSVLERRLERPECEWLKLLERKGNACEKYLADWHVGRDRMEKRNYSQLPTFPIYILVLFRYESHNFGLTNSKNLGLIRS